MELNDYLDILVFVCAILILIHAWELVQLRKRIEELEKKPFRGYHVGSLSEKDIEGMKGVSPKLVGLFEHSVKDRTCYYCGKQIKGEFCEVIKGGETIAFLCENKGCFTNGIVKIGKSFPPGGYETKRSEAD